MKVLLTIFYLSVISHSVLAQENGLQFDGVDDRVVTGNNLMSTPAGLTVAFWVLPDAVADGIAFDMEGIVKCQIRSSGNMKWCFDGSLPGGTGFAAGLNDGCKHHVWATNNGSLTEVFVDGVPLGTQAESMGNLNGVSRPTAIGSAWDGTSPYGGLIDELSIWNTSFGLGSTPTWHTQFRWTMCNIPLPLSGMWSYSPNVVAYYKFNHAAGTGTLTDLTGNGHTGTLTNMDNTNAWVDGACTYCASVPQWHTLEAIGRVQLTGDSQNLDNNTGSACGAYRDFTDCVTPPDLTAGSSYTLNVTMTTCDNGPYASRCNAWVDWNLDGDFSDAGEMLGAGTTSGGSNGFVFSFPFTVPGGTVAGYYPMRTRLHETGWKNATDPCENYHPHWDIGVSDYRYGETEDYILQVGTPMPVELGAFNGACSQNGNILTWSTITEKNNDYFELERLAGDSWRTVGIIDGNGTTLEHQYYTFVDEFANAGVSYYRLKQIDYDGSTDYSQVIAVERNDCDMDGFTIYPNPVSNYFVVVPQSKANKKLRIFDMTGRLILEEEISDFKRVDASNWSEGMYLIKIGDNQQRVMIYNQ